MAVCGAVLLKLGLPATFTLTVNWSLEVAQPSRSWIGPAPEQGEDGEAIGHLASKVVPVEPDEITEARADCAVESMVGQIEPRDMAVQEIRKSSSTKG
jgi:hypothetical protein